MRTGNILMLSAAMAMIFSTTSYAGVWRTGGETEQSRWWYDNENGTYASNGWYWLDGNGDGKAECYYFDSEGWMAADIITPDGYRVNENGAWVENGIVQIKSVESQEIQAHEHLRIQVEAAGRTLTFELNDSPAAKDLYRQLPLTVEVSDFSTNEKIFYPSEGLETEQTPLAQGGSGVLAYYRPWGNIVMFYGDFRTNNSLFELGQIIDGEEAIREIVGKIQISPLQ